MGPPERSWIRIWKMPASLPFGVRDSNGRSGPDLIFQTRGGIVTYRFRHDSSMEKARSLNHGYNPEVPRAHLHRNLEASSVPNPRLRNLAEDNRLGTSIARAADGPTACSVCSIFAARRVERIVTVFVLCAQGFLNVLRTECRAIIQYIFVCVTNFR